MKMMLIVDQICLKDNNPPQNMVKLPNQHFRLKLEFSKIS